MRAFTDKIHAAHGARREDDAGGVYPERITSEARYVASYRKQSTQTRPVTIYTRSSKPERGSERKADLHILFISSIREARARVITHSRTTNVN